MPLDEVRIKERFAFGEEYLNSLEKIIELGKEAFLNDFDLKIKGERIFEVLSKNMLDVCTHIIANKNISPPTSYIACMEKLGELNILNQEKTKIFRTIIGMRNIIMYHYDTIDLNILYEALFNISKDFLDFRTSIIKYIITN